MVDKKPGSSVYGLNKFFMTFSGRANAKQIVPWAEQHGVPIMDNALGRWSEAKSAFLHMWEYDVPRMVDSGGYNIQAKWIRDRIENPPPILTSERAEQALQSNPRDLDAELGRDAPFYPFTVEEYHEWLDAHSHVFDTAAAMDYACEEVFDPLWSVDERIEATLENTLEQFELDPEYDLMPVLQGRSVDDYVRCYDWLEDHGIPTHTVGLGTVCRISSSTEIVRTEQEVRERTGVDHIHGFGVKVTAFKLGATFETADSQAWVSAPANGMEVRDRGDRLEEIPNDNSKDRTFRSFKEYYRYVDRLMNGPEQQMEIADYC